MNESKLQGRVLGGDILEKRDWQLMAIAEITAADPFGHPCHFAATDSDGSASS